MTSQGAGVHAVMAPRIRDTCVGPTHAWRDVARSPAFDLHQVMQSRSNENYPSWLEQHASMQTSKSIRPL